MRNACSGIVTDVGRTAISVIIIVINLVMVIVFLWFIIEVGLGGFGGFGVWAVHVRRRCTCLSPPRCTQHTPSHPWQAYWHSMFEKTGLHKMQSAKLRGLTAAEIADQIVRQQKEAQKRGK